MNEFHTWLIIAVIALVTALLRFLPFVIFRNGKKTPPIIDKLGKTLPFAIMGMLVVYCLKGVHFTAAAGFVPSLVACAVVAVLYLLFRNTLLSIISGTVCYMVLVQMVF